jgi:anthranilate synthase component 1
MQDFKQIIKQSKIGTIVPLYKEIDYAAEPLEYFAKVSDNGRKENSILLESAEIITKYGEQSLGTSNPCLKLTGKGSSFKILALNDFGRRFLRFIKDDFEFCDSVSYNDNTIEGTLKSAKNNVSESERLNQQTHFDVIRTVLFKFKPTSKPVQPYCGLFGAIAYDFIDQFEDLPKARSDLLEIPDYELYFVDNLFLIDHKKNKTIFIANALIMDDDSENTYDRCVDIINEYENMLSTHLTKLDKNEQEQTIKIDTDTSKDEFVSVVKQFKEHIKSGDVFQAVPSRTCIVESDAEPLDIYKQLKSSNPSPYMFYIKNKNNILLGASPEKYLSVSGEDKKIVELRPIAGTKPRGLINGEINIDLDNKYETELKTDFKELAEHTMLIDLARNDVARICKPGTRKLDKLFTVEKYSHVQHLVSTVNGKLKDGLDMFHAYLGVMNMGTLTGAPKIEAMKLIRKYEKNKRGFYGGSVAYFTPHGEMDSTITIRSIFMKDNKAYIRAGAGIVHDSIPESEFEETEKKMSACLNAIKSASNKGDGNE